MATRLSRHEDIAGAEFRGENEGKGGESAQGGVLITFYGHF